MVSRSSLSQKHFPRRSTRPKSRRFKVRKKEVEVEFFFFFFPLSERLSHFLF